MVTESKVLQDLTRALWSLLGHKRLPFDVIDSASGEIFIPAGRPVLKRHCRHWALVRAHVRFEMYYPDEP